MDIDIFEAERVNNQSTQDTNECKHCGSKLHWAEQTDKDDDVCSDCYFFPIR